MGLCTGKSKNERHDRTATEWNDIANNHYNRFTGDFEPSYRQLDLPKFAESEKECENLRIRNRTLSIALDAKDKKIHDLQTRCESYRGAMITKNMKIDRYQREINDLDINLYQKSQEYDMLEVKYVDCRSKCKTYEQQFRDYPNKYKRSTECLEGMRSLQGQKYHTTHGKLDIIPTRTFNIENVDTCRRNEINQDVPYFRKKRRYNESPKYMSADCLSVKYGRLCESQTKLRALQVDKTNITISEADVLEELNIIKTENFNLKKEIDQLTQDNMKHRNLHEQNQKATYDFVNLQINNESLQNELCQAELALQNNSLTFDALKIRMQKQIDDSKILDDSMIAKLEQEKRDLELCISDLKRQNKKMESTITLQNTSLESVHRDDEYNAMKDSISQLTTQLESIRKTSVSSTDYNILQSKLRNTETELREAKQELAATKTRLQEQTTYADNLGTSKVAKLEQERHDLEISTANLKRKNDELKNDINQLTSRLKKREEDYDDMKRKLHHTEIELKESDSEKENLNVRVSVLEQQNNEVTDRANQLTTQFESIRKTFVSAADYNALKSQLQHSDTALRESDRELSAVRTRLQEHMTYADTLGNSKLSKLEQEKRDLKVYVAELKRENDEINNDKIQLRNQLESIQKVMDDNNGLQSRLHRTEKELRETDQVKKELKVCVADLEHQNADMKDSITQLTTQLESIRKELSKAELELDNTKRRLHILSDKDVYMNNETVKLRTRSASLEKELQQKNQEVKKYKQEMFVVHQTKQDTEKLVDTLSKERDRLQQKLDERDNNEKELRATISKQQQLMDSSKAEHKTEIAKHKQHSSDLEKYLTNLQQENNRMNEDMQRLTQKQERGQRDRHSSDDYEALQNRLHRVQKELKETEFELEDTKTRLSKCMGDKLTNNNPNIVDLSDMNRPSKLADRYKELYDNQWTDAYEILEISEGDEEHIIHILLNIFVETKQFCEDKTRTQMEATLKAVTHSDKVSVSDVPVTVLKYIKDCTKASSVGDVKKNFEEYKMCLQGGSFVSAKQALSTPDYLQECFEICWLMSIQDPPVVMSPLLKHGVAFQSSLYSAYTVSGNLIDFIVWPALLLHENGPTLTKGVAQGMKRK